MIDVNVNGEQYKLPQSWKEVSFKKFLQIADIKEQNKTKNSILILSSLMECPPELLYKVEVSSFTELMKNISFINTMGKASTPTTEFILGGKTYTTRKNLSDLTIGEMIDVEVAQELLKENNPQSFPKIIAILIREEGQTEYDSSKAAQIEEVIMNELNAEDAMSIVTFFLTGMMGFINNLGDSIPEIQKAMKKMKKK
jgi:hypothetical protein